MTFAPRALCTRCRRPQAVCWCGQLTRLESRIHTVFLQHPRETKVAIGTARMAHLSLPNSELHQGVDFQAHARVRELAAQEGTALLFPGPTSILPHTLVDTPPKNLIVVDGTWALAGKIIHVNPFFKALPRIGLVPPRPSNYRIRKEPSDECVSTIEAVVHVLGALEGDEARFEPLLAAFDWMIDRQLEWQSKRPGPPRVRVKKSPRPRRDFQLHELMKRPEDVVALYGESNAYPIEAGMEGPAELIHLAALRPATNERFEAFIQPRRPLAPNAPVHLEVPPERFLQGESITDAIARFARFIRPNDLYCGWGPYARELLDTEGGPERAFSDVRVITARTIKRRPGGVEQAMRLMGRAELPESIGAGRAGRRLAALNALIKLLIEGETRRMREG